MRGKSRIGPCRDSTQFPFKYQSHVLVEMEPWTLNTIDSSGDLNDIGWFLYTV